MNYEGWEAACGIRPRERAHHLVKKIVASFEPPRMHDAIRKALAVFVARRKFEGGAQRDF